MCAGKTTAFFVLMLDILNKNAKNVENIQQNRVGCTIKMSSQNVDALEWRQGISHNGTA